MTDLWAISRPEWWARGFRESGVRRRRRETTAARCWTYRIECGLPAVVEQSTERIVVLLLDGAIDAISAPVTPGVAAAQRLTSRGLVVPLIEHPRSHRVTFLTAAGLGPHPSQDRLVHLNVVVGGRPVVLPSPADERSGYRRWVQRPNRSQPLPPMSTVLDALTDGRP
ncbi:hypothetical protein [Nocardia farcinica]|uniref:hypothetical protein n=1 Tax=Nocardia farcinica TaxID=37329 RepID=UPI001893ACCA|nr:hypothetical protein [Nocardia farcinica]MBF6574096.1 hypothetical protein [Nocardia farcinica]